MNKTMDKCTDIVKDVWNKMLTGFGEMLKVNGDTARVPLG